MLWVILTMSTLKVLLKCFKSQSLTLCRCGVMQGLRCSFPTLCVREYSPLWEATTNTTTTATGQCPYTQTCRSQCIITFTVFHSRALWQCWILFLVCCRDCLALCCLNSATSIFAGFAVFSVLGFMAHELNMSLPEVAVSGELMPYFYNICILYLTAFTVNLI